VFWVFGVLGQVRWPIGSVCFWGFGVFLGLFGEFGEVWGVLGLFWGGLGGMAYCVCCGVLGFIFLCFWGFGAYLSFIGVIEMGSLGFIFGVLGVFLGFFGEFWGVGGGCLFIFFGFGNVFCVVCCVLCVCNLFYFSIVVLLFGLLVFCKCVLVFWFLGGSVRLRRFWGPKSHAKEHDTDRNLTRYRAGGCVV